MDLTLTDLREDTVSRGQRTYINEYGAFNIDGSSQGLNKVDPMPIEDKVAISLAVHIQGNQQNWRDVNRRV